MKINDDPERCVLSMLDSIYGKSNWTWLDIDYDWDEILDEIGKENENILRIILCDMRKAEESEQV